MNFFDLNANYQNEITTYSRRVENLKRWCYFTAPLWRVYGWNVKPNKFSPEPLFDLSVNREALNFYYKNI